MPVKRRLSKQLNGRVTPQIVFLYQKALALRARSHLSDEHRHQAHAAERDVDRAMNVKLWETSIFDTFDYPAEPGDQSWENAMELRQRLDAALAQASAAPRQGTISGPEPTAA